MTVRAVRAGAPAATRRPVLHRRSALGLAALALGLLLVVGSMRDTAAAFTDAEYVAGSTLTAGTLAAPTSPQCTGGVTATASLSWTAPTTGITPTGYHVKVGAYDGVVTGTSTNVTRTQAGGTGTFTASITAVAGGWESSAITASITYSLILGFIPYTDC